MRFWVGSSIVIIGLEGWFCRLLTPRTSKKCTFLLPLTEHLLRCLLKFYCQHIDDVLITNDINHQSLLAT